MVDITEISAMVAAAGVLVGVVYYVLEIRYQTRTKQMDLIMRIRSMWMDKEMLQSWDTIKKTEFKNYDDYKEKCPVQAEQVATFFDSLGLLLHRGLVDIDLISQLFFLETPWKKMKLYVEGIRERAKEPRVYRNFEYLYNEWKKREQKFQPKA